jgi:hypothetical protein
MYMHVHVSNGDSSQGKNMTPDRLYTTSSLLPLIIAFETMAVSHRTASKAMIFG